MSRVSKGNYYVNRTKEWLVSIGYEVEKVEKQQRILNKAGEVIFLKRDLWACDLVARNEEEMLWVQVKSNPAHIADGLKKLAGGKWPQSRVVRRWVVCWEPRARLVDGPRIHELTEGEADEQRGRRGAGLRALPQVSPEGVSEA